MKNPNGGGHALGRGVRAPGDHEDRSERIQAVDEGGEKP